MYNYKHQRKFRYNFNESSRKNNNQEFPCRIVFVEVEEKFQEPYSVRPHIVFHFHDHNLTDRFAQKILSQPNALTDFRQIFRYKHATIATIRHNYDCINNVEEKKKIRME